MEPDDNISAVFSVQEYVAILRRRRWIILQAFVLIAVIGVAQALMAKNVYQASPNHLCYALSVGCGRSGSISGLACCDTIPLFVLV